jgi:yersiniabactin salicyl-AMP ligase
MNPHLVSLARQFPEPIGEQLRYWAKQYSQQAALIDGSSHWTYAELNQTVDRLSNGFYALGLRSGDRVLIQLPNQAGFIFVLFALIRIGCIPILAMPSQRPYDIQALLELAEPVAYVIPQTEPTHESRTFARKLATQQPQYLRWILIDDDTQEEFSAPFIGLSSLYSDRPISGAPPQPDSTALLLLSGGTTGTPKLIPRTHADYTYNYSESAKVCQLDHSTVYLAVLPTAHNFTLACPGILGTLANGGTVVLSDTASCDEAMPLIEREGITHLALVPALAKIWVDARQWEASDLSSLKQIQIGGAKLSPQVAEELLATFPATLQQVFGMAEGLLCYTRPNDVREKVLHSQGYPLSPQDEIRIVDESDREVAQGETGQLLTRGPYTITGYYRADAQNRTSFTPDGFYRTGDRVCRDADGYLYVEGRLKEQINRAGEKIAAAEVEAALNSLSVVTSSAVVAVPDTLLGERICAFIIAQDQPVDKISIRQQLSHQGLTTYKQPDQVEWVTHWPLTAVGKIDKNKLVALARQREVSSG